MLLPSSIVLLVLRWVASCKRWSWLAGHAGMLLRGFLGKMHVCITVFTILILLVYFSTVHYSWTTLLYSEYSKETPHVIVKTIWIVYQPLLACCVLLSFIIGRCWPRNILRAGRYHNGHNIVLLFLLLQFWMVWSRIRMNHELTSMHAATWSASWRAQHVHCWFIARWNMTYRRAPNSIEATQKTEFRSLISNNIIIIII